MGKFCCTRSVPTTNSYQIFDCMYYAETCNEFSEPISPSLHPGNIAFFEQMLKRWRAVGNIPSDLTGPRFEPQTSRSRHERVTARPTGWFENQLNCDLLTYLRFKPANADCNLYRYFKSLNCNFRKLS